MARDCYKSLFIDCFVVETRELEISAEKYSKNVFRNVSYFWSASTGANLSSYYHKTRIEMRVGTIF